MKIHFVLVNMTNNEYSDKAAHSLSHYVVIIKKKTKSKYDQEN